MDLTAPCNWPTPDPLCECEALDTLTAEQVTTLEEWTVSDLWEATGRVFGTCEVSVYPCNDYSTLCWCGNPYRRCGCVSVSEIKLPGPVASVTEVLIDGVALDPGDYRIDDYQWLVRLDGGSWPVNVDPTDPDGFVVTYEQGIAPPAGASVIAGVLACERAKALCGDNTCRLPGRVQQVTRQGVTMLWNDGDGFGLPEVDTWVRNARAPLLAGAVHSPDLPSVRRTTWEATSP